MRKRFEWEPRPIGDLGDLIGYTIMLNSYLGSYQGGLRDITEEEIHIEIAEEQVLAIDRDVLYDESVELFVAKAVF